MNVLLRTDDRTFVERLVRDGQDPSVADAVSDGIRALRERESRRNGLRGALDHAIELGGDFTSEEVLSDVETVLDDVDRSETTRA